MQRFLISLLAMAGCHAAAAEQATSVTQYDITWTFDKEYPTGRFITGDWWVVGPVQVVSVTPAPGPGQTVVPDYRSIYGTPATQEDTTMRNGSMIVANPGPNQGFDSRLLNYRAELSVNFPITINPGQTLISTISNGGERTQAFAHAILWRSEKESFHALKAGAVLTVLDKVPPANAFRPAFSGKTLTIFTRDQVDTSKLLKLPVIAGMPNWEQFERYFERPYITDIIENWMVQLLGPNENQPSSPREVARIGGMASLMLNSDVPDERKEKLLIGLIQHGIDAYGVIDAGRREYRSGCKWPIVFAGILLDEPEMIDVGQIALFHEDQKTYYGEGWAGQKALFQNLFHTMPALPYEHKMPETWTSVDNPETGSNDRKSEGYRSVNLTAWPATALVVRLMGLVKEWNHDAFFDYIDRVMSAEDPYVEARKASTDPQHQVRPNWEGKTADPWVDAMWKTYRLTAPEPQWAGNNRMWIWIDHRFPGKGEWQPNPKPAEPSESYVAPR